MSQRLQAAKMLLQGKTYNEIVEETKNKTPAENSGKSSSSKDLNNEGGRPALDDTQKSEKTEANQKAEG